MGAEELALADAVKRVAGIVGKRPLYVPLPVWSIRILAQVTEWLMVVPLVAKAQAQMLAEGVSEPAPWAPELPLELRPSHPFDEAAIRAALPQAGPFGLDDLVTHRVSIDRAPELYETFQKKEDGCIKVVLDPAA